MREADKLRARWSRRERDLMLHWPDGEMTSADGRWLALSVFSREVREELGRRGYDITTLRFSVEPRRGEQRFDSQRSNAS